MAQQRTSQLRTALYAIVGSGELVAARTAGAFRRARSFRPDPAGTFKGLAERGERVIVRTRKSKPARRAAEGTRQAVRQLKGAYTSVRKAVGQESKPARKAG